MNPNIGEPDTELKSQTSLEIGQILPLFLHLCFMHKDPSLLPLDTLNRTYRTMSAPQLSVAFLKDPVPTLHYVKLQKTNKSRFMLKPTGGNITAVQMLLSAP